MLQLAAAVSDFSAGLVQNAWVGTTPQQSAMLEPIIESILREGRAVILAVKTQKERGVFEDEDF